MSVIMGSIRESLQRERNVRESIDVKELGSRLTQDRLDINVLNSVSHHPTICRALLFHLTHLYPTCATLGNASPPTRDQRAPSTRRSISSTSRGDQQRLANLRRGPQDGA